MYFLNIHWGPDQEWEYDENLRLFLNSEVQTDEPVAFLHYKIPA